jgi:polyisoprenoid-binding protein YceI
MRRFLGVMGLAAVSAFVGCNPDQAGNTAPQPPIPSPGPSAAGDPLEPSGPVTPAAPAALGALTPENTKIEFVGTKKDGRHVGGFAQFSGSISPIQGDFPSRIAVEIDTESLFADDPKLANHLKSPDFFEVRKYPKASFVSTVIQPSQEGEATHLITGDLTLHGTTKSISIPAKVTETEDTLTLDSTFQIDRTEYGIAFRPEMVDPTVTITVSAKVARQ